MRVLITQPHVLPDIIQRPLFPTLPEMANLNGSSGRGQKSSNRGPPPTYSGVPPRAAPARTSARSSTRGPAQYQMVIFIYFFLEAKLMSLQQEDDNAPEVAIAFVSLPVHFDHFCYLRLWFAGNPSIISTALWVPQEAASLPYVLLARWLRYQESSHRAHLCPLMIRTVHKSRQRIQSRYWQRTTILYGSGTNRGRFLPRRPSCHFDRYSWI